LSTVYSRVITITDNIQPYSAPTTYPEDGPLHKLLAGLLTKARIDNLGFIAWDKVEGLVGRAFKQKDANAMRFAFTIAQWVIIGERFKVKTATPNLVERP
jgi:asparagine synthase (glutamine-hydrolysing)